MDTNSLEHRIPSNPDELLGIPLTAEYMPQSIPSGFLTTRNRPPFSSFVIDEMLTDSKVIYGLYLLKGPLLANSRFSVESDNSAVKEYLIKQINRFWRTSAIRALRGLEWGYGPSEALYRVLQGGIHFDTLKDVHPRDTRVVSYRGELCGITVQGVPRESNPNDKQRIYLGGPKAFLHVHWRDRHPWYGMSRCYGCYVPWWEAWTEGGYRDIRRLWFFKNAFEGGTMYHPPGAMRDSGGNMVTAKDYAREMIEKKRTGGVLTLPNVVGADGAQQWTYEPPTANAAPDNLLEYGDTLGREILEGLGIPPEVIESGGDTGFGSATGRQVPQTAYYAILQDLAQWLITDFDAQILRPLVALNFSVEDSLAYDIVVFPMDDNRGEYNGNQFTDEDQKAQSPQAQEEMSADDYEKEASSTLKKESGFQMHTGGSKKEGDFITIGGHPQGNKKHVGGFPAMIGKDGIILAGGPKAIRGTHVQDVGQKFKEMRGQPSKPYHDDDDPRHTPQHKAHNLPHPDSDLGKVLHSHSEDPEEQAAFHAHLQTVHGEHQKTVEDFRTRQATVSPQKRTYGGAKVQELPALLQKHGMPASDGATTMLEGAIHEGRIKDQRDLLLTMKKIGTAFQKTNDVRGSIESVLGKRQARQQTAKNWQTVVRETAEEYKVDPQEFRKAADEYHDLQYGVQARANKFINQLRQRITTLSGETWDKVSELESRESNRAMESILEDVLSNSQYNDELNDLGLATISADDTAQARDNKVSASEGKLWDILVAGPRPVPKKTDDAFVGEVLNHMGISPDEMTDLPMHHPSIVNKAYKSLHNKIIPSEEDDTSFDTDSLGSDNF